MTTPPPWLVDFVNRAAEHLHAVDVMSPLGCHTFHDPEGWEITLFASASEVVGGVGDGRRCASRFFADVKAISEQFDEVDTISWQTHRLDADDDLGSHIAVEGQVQGEHVWLRILANAPRQSPPGRKGYAYLQLWEEAW